MLLEQGEQESFLALLQGAPQGPITSPRPGCSAAWPARKSEIGLPPPKNFAKRSSSTLLSPNTITGWRWPKNASAFATPRPAIASERRR